MQVKQLIALLTQLEDTATVEIAAAAEELILRIDTVEQCVYAEDTDNNTGLVLLHSTAITQA